MAAMSQDKVDILIVVAACFGLGFLTCAAGCLLHWLENRTRPAVTRRPCWSDAPEWAWYLMQGSDGGWIWLEKNPAQGGVTAGRHLPAVVHESYCLERRPQ